jgi:septal ring factor EnvC (AmiA/AmiB activator)
VDNAFDLLEQRVRRAAEALRRYQGENAELKKQLGRAEAALHQAEKALSAAEKHPAASSPGDAQKLESMGKELNALRKDREELRQRIGRLVEVLEGLE